MMDNENEGLLLCYTRIKSCLCGWEKKSRKKTERNDNVAEIGEIHGVVHLTVCWLIICYTNVDKIIIIIINLKEKMKW